LQDKLKLRFKPIQRIIRLQFYTYRFTSSWVQPPTRKGVNASVHILKALTLNIKTSGT